MADPLLVVKNLKKYFPVKRGLLSRVTGHVRAVDGVSFKIEKGETLGLVGESGCGKTTLGRTLLLLYRPTGGEIIYRDRDILSLSPSKLRKMRARMQIIFQDPFGSLNPRMTVGDIIGEGLRIHHPGISAVERTKRVQKTLEEDGLSPSHYSRYPHEFSGGQRQRIGIARAVSVEPEFIVCDEAVSALDLSVQAKIINLLIKLKETRGLSYLFIAHDLTVVRHIADRVAVLYLGRLVEEGETETIFSNPLHPYTEMLLASAPARHPSERGQRHIARGDVPSPIHPPEGCPFHPRCPYASNICREIFPEAREDKNHIVFCHHHDRNGFEG